MVTILINKYNTINIINTVILEDENGISDGGGKGDKSSLITGSGLISDWNTVIGCNSDTNSGFNGGVSACGGGEEGGGWLIEILIVFWGIICLGISASNKISSCTTNVEGKWEGGSGSGIGFGEIGDWPKSIESESDKSIEVSGLA